MAVSSRLSTYLQKARVTYEPIVHRVVYTAYDTASTLKRELHEVAKNLLIDADGVYVLAIVPASMRIDLKKLKKAIGAKKVSIPNEKVMVKVFNVKPGAITPFGGMHKVAVWVDKAILKSKDIILSAGTFRDSIVMKANDFVALEKATLASFAQKGDYLTLEQARKKSLQQSAKKKGKKKPIKVSKVKPSKSKKTVKKSIKKKR